MLRRQQLTREQALQKARHYCAYQERCHSEVKEKLYSFGLWKNDVEESLSLLIEENYLNEERYAVQYAGGRFRMKHWGRVKIRYELRQKQVSEDNIKKALAAIDEDSYLRALEDLAAEKWESLREEANAYVKKHKVHDYLLQKGYEPDLVGRALAEINEASMSTLTITTIQTDLSWEDKEANLGRLEEKINGIREHTEVIVLPEMFSTGFSMDPGALAESMDGPSVNWMKKMAARKRCILTGSLIIAEEGNYFNRLIWMLPNGEYGYYDKRHRFAYAGEDEKYEAGDKRLIASVKGWKVHLLVCYDLRFPVWSRQRPPVSRSPGIDSPQDSPKDLSLPESASGVSPALEYDLIIYVANWPERRTHAWKTLLQARAIENQSFVVGVNRIGNDGNAIRHSGDSMIVGPLGEILYHAPEKEDIFTATLRKDQLEEARTRFPFWKDADQFSIKP